MQLEDDSSDGVREYIYGHDIQFGGKVVPKSVETTKKEGVERGIKTAPLVVGVRTVALYGANDNHLGVFVEVLEDR